MSIIGHKNVIFISKLDAIYTELDTCICDDMNTMHKIYNE